MLPPRKGGTGLAQPLKNESKYSRLRATSSVIVHHEQGNAAYPVPSSREFVFNQQQSFPAGPALCGDMPMSVVRQLASVTVTKAVNQGPMVIRFCHGVCTESSTPCWLLHTQILLAHALLEDVVHGRLSVHTNRHCLQLHRL